MPVLRRPAAASASKAKDARSKKASVASGKQVKGARAKAAGRKKANLPCDVLEREAERFGFDAREYLEDGVTILKKPILSQAEVRELADVARRVRASSAQEFVFMRSHSESKDKKRLFSLLERYAPLLKPLFGGGIRMPLSDKAPHAHHNQIQVAIKVGGFQGYTEDGSMEKMYVSTIGHIDQTLAKQNPRGQYMRNYTALLGVVLDGATESRDDAGNLFVGPTTHNQLAEAFKLSEDKPRFYTPVVTAYLDPKNPPPMRAVRARPGQAILMHHQTVHGVAPNRSDADRIHVYFRVTASQRPSGKLVSYPEAMYDPTLETPLLRELAGRQLAQSVLRGKQTQRLEFVQHVNPKRPTSEAHSRYEKYKKAKTLARALALGAKKSDISQDLAVGACKPT